MQFRPFVILNFYPLFFPLKNGFTPLDCTPSIIHVMQNSLISRPISYTNNGFYFTYYTQIVTRKFEMVSGGAPGGRLLDLLFTL